MPTTRRTPRLGDRPEPPAIHAVVARNVARRRRQRGMSQQLLAETLNHVSRSTHYSRSVVAAIENGLRKTDLSDLAPLCLALGTDLRGLLEGDGEEAAGRLTLNQVRAVLFGEPHTLTLEDISDLIQGTVATSAGPPDIEASVRPHPGREG